jgi:diguanylate cyclase (GGDEF)-like protein
MRMDMSPEEYDPLTGLYSRRYAIGAFERLLASERQNPGPVAVIYADVDRMHGYNEVYGLSCGDELIRRVGGAIKAAVGEDGFTCRYSGDEFMTFLPGLSAAAAGRKAEEVRRAVEAVTYPETQQGGVPNYRTITLGVAAFPDNGLDPIAVIRKADEALWRGKEAGRGRVFIA